MRDVTTLLFSLLCAGGAAAQEAAQPPDQPPPPSRFEEQVDVIGLTPIHGIGLPKGKIPANVQVFSTRDLATSTAIDVPSFLGDRAASVQTSDAHGGAFQPDLLFRGFAASPLLGASEGLAVYQDGVRINEPFGDTVSWDLLPSSAIASINLMPGSNPLFGLNALAGALSIRTRNGFDFPGRRFSLSTGSFGRHQLGAEWAGHSQTLGYYLAGTLTREAGWRDVSRSAIHRLFADLAWRGTRSTLSVSLTAATNDLAGNGSAPVDLLAERRSAVFTHPDLTDNDVALVTLRATRQASERTLLEGVAYVRRSGVRTFNGDAADDDDDDAGDTAFDAINNVSRTRSRGLGVTAQLTRTAPLLGLENHLIAGGAFDAAFTRFDFASEWATLTPSRGTQGTGIWDDDSLVDLRATAATGGLFISDTWSVTPRVTLSAAARLNATTLRLRDRIGTSLNGDHAFWRANPASGITYDAWRGVNVYAGYSEASRVPTPVELTCADPEDPCRLPNAFLSDPPLDQVVARTFEAGIRRSSAPLTWGVTAFTTAAHDDIVFISSGTLQGEGHFENIDRTLRRGLEATIEIAVGRWSAFAAYTAQRATFGTDLRIASRHHPSAVSHEIVVDRGDRLPGVPGHSGKAGISATLASRVTVSAVVRGQSSQYFRGDETNLLRGVPGFAVVDSRARVRVGRHVAVTAQIQNILNARFATFGVLGDAALVGSDDPRFLSPGAPRGAWAGVDLDF